MMEMEQFMGKKSRFRWQRIAEEWWVQTNSRHRGTGESVCQEDFFVFYTDALILSFAEDKVSGPGSSWMT